MRRWFLALTTLAVCTWHSSAEETFQPGETWLFTSDSGAFIVTFLDKGYFVSSLEDPSSDYVPFGTVTRVPGGVHCDNYLRPGYCVLIDGKPGVLWGRCRSEEEIGCAFDITLESPGRAHITLGPEGDGRSRRSYSCRRVHASGNQSPVGCWFSELENDLFFVFGSADTLVIVDDGQALEARYRATGTSGEFEVSAVVEGDTMTKTLNMAEGEMRRVTGALLDSLLHADCPEPIEREATEQAMVALLSNESLDRDKRWSAAMEAFSENNCWIWDRQFMLVCAEAPHPPKAMRAGAVYGALGPFLRTRDLPEEGDKILAAVAEEVGVKEGVIEPENLLLLYYCDKTYDRKTKRSPVYEAFVDFLMEPAR